MTTITFIQKPAFIIDFSQYDSPKKETPALPATLAEKIQNVLAFSLEGISYFFIALNRSIREEVKYLGTSFKAIVLDKSGLLRNPKEIEFILATLYTGVWIVGMGFNITLTTGRLWFQHFFPKITENEVKHYIDSEMNVDHIKTEDLALNTSAVPPDITIDLLADILEEVNFDDPHTPGYMPPSTRKELHTTYTPAQLKSSLETFIKNVKNRTPFLGTPASYDIPRLMAFYQQIEDAVRLSIQQIENKMKLFKAQNGETPSQYNLVQLNEYKGILEDRARIAIDLAIAGNHCGARYMGESMSVYYITIKNQLSDDKNLEKTIIEILAKKRKEIATEHIETYLGNDTHAYASYMGTLGATLAIPGTQNIIEQLAHPLDTDKFKRLFFDAYNIDTIIETIQDQLKTSHSFREKVIDWLKEQALTWNDLSEHETQHLKKSIVDQITSVIKKNDIKNAEDSPLENLKRMLGALKDNQISIPSLDEGWDIFLDNLLALKESKEWCNDNLPNDPIVSPIGNVKKRNAFKTACLEAKLGAEFVKKLAVSIKERGLFSQEHLEGDIIAQKVHGIRTIFKTEKLPPPASETIQRMISGKTAVQEVVAGVLDLIRQSNFISALNLDEMHTKGLSPELIEWILVSQRILLPQNNITAKKVSEGGHVAKFTSTVIKHIQMNLIQKLLIENWIESLKTASADAIENDAKNILSLLPETQVKRYRFEASHREKLLKIIFMNSYKHSPIEIAKSLPIQDLEEDEESPSIDFNSMTQIRIPRIIGSVINSIIFKVAASISAIALTIFAGSHLHYALMNQTATASFKTTLDAAIKLFLVERSFSAAWNTWTSCNYIGEYCKIISNEFETEYLKTVKEKIFPIWMGAMI